MLQLLWGRQKSREKEREREFFFFANGGISRLAVSCIGGFSAANASVVVVYSGCSRNRASRSNSSSSSFSSSLTRSFFTSRTALCNAPTTGHTAKLAINSTSCWCASAWPGYGSRCCCTRRFSAGSSVWSDHCTHPEAHDNVTVGIQLLCHQWVSRYITAFARLFSSPNFLSFPYYTLSIICFFNAAATKSHK